MADIRSVFISMEQGIDYALEQLDLVQDDGLDSAVIISLFTDRRAGRDVALQEGQDRRGWWGDTFAEIEGDEIGSHLWLLDRAKQLPAVMADAKVYIEQALAHLVADGMAKRIEVRVSNPRMGILSAQIDIYKPDGTTTQYKFEHFWSKQ